jgi:hypothetical protein
MSEDEARNLGHEEEADETEAHGRATANIEPGDEADDDVEAHMRRKDTEDAREF